MKVTRYLANRIFHILEAAPLGSLDDTNLEAAIQNFDAFRKVIEEYESLKSELFKRLYGDMSKKSDEEKKALAKFFEIVKNMRSASEEEKVRLEALAKSDYPELYELRKKELDIIISLLNKVVEVEVKKVDKDELVKCILKGNKDVSVGEIHALFLPMYETDEKPEATFDEIDELLK